MYFKNGMYLFLVFGKVNIVEYFGVEVLFDCVLIVWGGLKIIDFLDFVFKDLMGFVLGFIYCVF